MKEKASNKEKFIWNILGGLSSSGSSLILSIAVNRILGGTQGGVFAFAYANAQLMYTIGAFEVRPFQSTDVEEKYSFKSYFSLRMLTCTLMMLASLFYIMVNNFSLQKSIVVILMAVFKMWEAFTEVYAGRFQQKDRIDLSGKLYFVRMVASIVAFIVAMLVTKDLVMASVLMCATSILLFFVYDYRYVFDEDKKNIGIETKYILKLLKEVLPLFIGAFIMMYISNAPKYAIEAVYDDDMQNIYNILFMPAFVINMFSIFVFRPLLTGMAVDWNAGKLVKLRNILIKMYSMIIGLTVMALIGTWLLGVPILSALYGIDLEPQKVQLLCVMLTGGISALLTFSCQVITIMRQQNIMLLGYVVAFVYAFIISRFLVRRFAINGAILAYGTSMGLLVLIGICIIIVMYNKAKKIKKEK